MAADGENPVEGGAPAPTVGFALVAAGVLLLTWPTWRGLGHVWLHQFGYTHGLLVAPIAAWLTWRALARRPPAQIAPIPRADLVVAILALAWLLFRLASIRTLEQLTAVVLLWAAATTVLGWRAGRLLLFPIGYLLFAVPIWEGFVPFLQPMTTAAAGYICDLMGIPTYLDGNVVHIPNGVFSIEEGCAGSHYLVSAITLAALYAYLEYRRWRSGLIVVGLAAVLAIVCNWLRVVLVIRAGYLSGMQHPWVRDHNMVGWGLFAVALVPFFLVARNIEDPHAASEPAAGPLSDQRASGRRFALTLGAVLATIAVPGIALGIVGIARPPAGPAFASAPAGQSGWAGPLPPDVEWTPDFPAADSVVRVAYERDSTRLTFFVASYRDQADGKEVISYDNHLEGRDTWRTLDDSSVQLKDLGTWRKAVLADTNERHRVVYYQYSVGGRRMGSRLSAKVWQVLGRLSGNQSAGIVGASVACRTSSCDGASGEVLRFLDEMGLSSWMP